MLHDMISGMILMKKGSDQTKDPYSTMKELMIILGSENRCFCLKCGKENRAASMNQIYNQGFVSSRDVWGSNTSRSFGTDSIMVRKDFFVDTRPKLDAREVYRHE